MQCILYVCEIETIVFMSIFLHLKIVRTLLEFKKMFPKQSIKQCLKKSKSIKYNNAGHLRNN